jgi:hypothetical protein
MSAIPEWDQKRGPCFKQGPRRTERDDILSAIPRRPLALAGRVRKNLTQYLQGGTVYNTTFTNPPFEQAV